ncbi:DUF1648 domain-containing protein [Halorientalis regularis]|jgi:uncharacterized membrane protein|uniref:DUF1648 domain-containing protein n=1 Tax=Halorientalis regularis TaxID=660518 RepID=A0A1G7HP48_9EURY|nr:DUF1648 domain-containing protein [Halorientalis regularis]SDF02096.1 Protein of unknown function [Halorientalis regularis]
MARSLTRLDAISGGLALLTALAGLAVYPRLPAEVAIHFSASGQPDNYAPRAVAVAAIPVVMVLTHLVIKWAARVDPPDDPRTMRGITVATMLLLAVVHGLVLAWNLGYAVPFDLVLVGVLVWGALVAGYAVVREYGLGI